VQVAFDAHWLIGYLLAFSRSMGFILVAFPFAMSVVPITARMAIGVAFGIGTESALVHAMVLPTTTGGLIGATAEQLLIGAALGFFAMLFVSLGESAGGLVGLFGGFSTPPAIDPLSSNEIPVTGEFYNFMWIVLFFVSGADVVVIHGYFASFATPNLFHLSFTLGILVKSVTILFLSSLEVASPILAVMFFSQIVVGILTKVAPQLYALTFIFPLQILLSFIMMLIALPLLPHFFDASMRDLLAAEHDLLVG
jgi:flagellar biosynthetic protein FliR